MMTTGTPEQNAEVEAATQRVRELSERVLEQAKSNGMTWLEGYERVLRNLLEFEEQAAKSSGAEWVTNLATTHANFVRETSEVFFSSLREQLKG
jgi:hypothetical protein